jgi:hypothetical protein
VPNVRFVWTSSQPRVAPVDPTSPDDSTRATGDSVGTTKIVATAQGVRSDSATLVVIASPVSTLPDSGLTSCAALKPRVHGWIVSVDFSYSYSVSGADTSTGDQVGYSLEHQGSATMRFDQYMGDSSFASFTNWNESQASDAIKGHISMLEKWINITQNDVLAIEGDGDAVKDPQFPIGWVTLATDNDLHVCTLQFTVSPTVFASIGSGQIVTNAYVPPAGIDLLPVALPDTALLSTPLTVAGDGQFGAWAIEEVAPDSVPKPLPGWYHLYSPIAAAMVGTGVTADGKLGTAHVRWSITAIE